MLIPTKHFNNATKEEKLEFFLKCQSLLVEHHPDSPFVFREDNVDDRMKDSRAFLFNYKGLIYMDDNICVLFNKIKRDEGMSAVEVLNKYKFQPPDPDFNAVSIDFVVFRNLKDCAEWTKNQYDPRIKYVIYVKNGTPQFYQTEKLISRIFQMPLAHSP